MYKQLRILLAISLMIVTISMICGAIEMSSDADVQETILETVPETETVAETIPETTEPPQTAESTTAQTTVAEFVCPLSDSDVSLIALVTMAEAEGEPEKGQRLVIDTILNRVDSKHFPDTVHGVIYQKNHFSSIWNGRVNKCEVQEKFCQLVIEELESRTNTDVMFFTAGVYGKYGKPMFKLGNHYFASYE